MGERLNNFKAFAGTTGMGALGGIGFLVNTSVGTAHPNGAVAIGALGGAAAGALTALTVHGRQKEREAAEKKAAFDRKHPVPAYLRSEQFKR